MIYLIPTSQTESWYEQRVRLDGVVYSLRLAWAERERRWFADLRTASGQVVFTNRKVVADRPLTERLTSLLRPAGEIWCVDRSGAGRDPDLRDLGARCLLLYVDAESSGV
jgi:Domain of unknown function (DUF6983)